MSVGEDNISPSIVVFTIVDYIGEEFLWTVEMRTRTYTEVFDLRPRAQSASTGMLQ